MKGQPEGAGTYKFTSLAKLTQTCDVSKHLFWIILLDPTKRNIIPTSYHDRHIKLLWHFIQRLPLKKWWGGQGGQGDISHTHTKKNDRCPANTKFNKHKEDVWELGPHFLSAHIRSPVVYFICSQIYFLENEKGEPLKCSPSLTSLRFTPSFERGTCP